MTKLAHLLLVAIVAAAPAGAALAQSKLPLRDYGYDRRYEKDRTVRGGVDDYTRSGRSGLAADGARQSGDRAGSAGRSDYMDLRTRPFDDRGSSLGSRPSVDGGRSRSFSD